MRQPPYFSDKPCKRGHVGLRFASNHGCIPCRNEKALETTRNAAALKLGWAEIVVRLPPERAHVLRQVAALLSHDEHAPAVAAFAGAMPAVPLDGVHVVERAKPAGEGAPPLLSAAEARAMADRAAGVVPAWAPAGKQPAEHVTAEERRYLAGAGALVPPPPVPTATLAQLFGLSAFPEPVED